MNRRFPLMAVAVASALIAFTALTTPVRAQDSSLDLGDRRFAFYRVDNGYLRLDLRTGEVAVCSQHAADWVCTLTPDERTALEGEIARLQRENVGLKDVLLRRGLPLPDGATAQPVPSAPPPGATAKTEPPKPVEPSLRLPDNADINRAIALMENVWRRLVEMVARIQRDFEQKT